MANQLNWLNFRSTNWGKPVLINKLVELFVVPKNIYTYDEIDLKFKFKEFYEQNKDILDCSRGSGYWLWKPYLIKKVLNIIDPDDFVLYSDAGKSFKYLPFTNCAGIIAWMKNNNLSVFPGIRIPEYGTNENWCKKEVWVKEIAEESQQLFLSSSQYQATVLAFKNNNDGNQFVDEWLRLCTKKDYINDKLDLEFQNGAFIEHRHDQSLLSIVAFNYSSSAVNDPGYIINIGKSVSVIDLYCRSKYALLYKTLYFLLDFLLVVIRRMYVTYKGLGIR